MASCLYFCPNVFLLPRAVPYASIFCIIVHGIVFLTVYLNLPPAWHLIQCNHGLQAYNIHQEGYVHKHRAYLTSDIGIVKHTCQINR